jgi:tRNA-(ms[2]io[6]A)-hydroxylase
MPQTDDPWSRQLVDSMVLLIKEELHHFWQVREMMQAHDIPYVKITASNYARGLRREVRSHEPVMLIDKLICGAYIEARSCERFAALAPWLNDDLQKFYLSLLRSEARHYQDYLDLAQQIAEEDISERIHQLGEAEAALINAPEAEFRFHSGVPMVAA